MAPVSGRFQGTGLALTGLVAGVIGAGLWALALTIDPERALLGWLGACVTVAAPVIGVLVLQMIGYAANARWMAATRRILDAVTPGLVPLAVLFVPVLLGVEHIYPWTDPASTAEPERVEAKRAYLDTGFFAVRTGIYFVVWIAAATLLRHWSHRRDDNLTPPADPVEALRRERALSAALLPAVGLAITFAAFDWLMSLQPTWYSSIFGIYYFAGGFVAGIALVIVLTARGLASGSLAVAVTPNHFHALGRLLLAFTVFWAYAAFFQGMLIQIANRPEEVEFYVDRLGGGWQWLLVAVIIGHFALPFLLLLPRRPKFIPRYLTAVALLIMVSHVGDLYWVVIPAGGGPAAGPHWADAAALVAVAGFTCAWCAWRQHRRPLVAEGDPFLPEGSRYASPL